MNHLFDMQSAAEAAGGDGGDEGEEEDPDADDTKYGLAHHCCHSVMHSHGPVPTPSIGVLGQAAQTSQFTSRMQFVHDTAGIQHQFYGGVACTV